MYFLTISTLIATLGTSSAISINWWGNWALDCRFTGNDIANYQVPGSECGGKCWARSDCTHFSWNNDLGGTCWLKGGYISKENAEYKQGDVCGVTRENQNIAPATTTTTTPSTTTTSSINNATTTASNDNNQNAFPGGKFRHGLEFDGSYKNSDYQNYDYISIWMNTIDYNKNTDFNVYYQGVMIDKCKELNKIPLFYAYVIAFEARASLDIQDCDVNPGYSLCNKGANYIRANRAHLVSRYRYQAQQISQALGDRNAVAIFLIEPDFWQYYGDSHQEGGALSGDYMRSLFDDFVGAIKSELPNAIISWDISAWIGENGMRQWWSYFASSPHINFVSTSGGQARADLNQIKPNELEWAVVHQITGKKIIADCGYGVAGSASDTCLAWNVANTEARVQDGVVALSSGTGALYNPAVVIGNTPSV